MFVFVNVIRPQALEQLQVSTKNGTPSFCAAVRSPHGFLSPALRDTTQTSRGKFDRLRRTPARSTPRVLDGYGLRDSLPARPAREASYPVSVRQVAALLHASFRPRLAATPLRFANPSPPSGWVEDFHLQAAVHARHTRKEGGHCHPLCNNDGCSNLFR